MPESKTIAPKSGCYFDLDHVHLLINCSPQHHIPDMIKALKGISARLLMKKYGEYINERLWGGHLWNPSYFIATVSENTEKQIREYIQNQKKVSEVRRWKEHISLEFIQINNNRF